jgi:hypothetical protein
MRNFDEEYMVQSFPLTGEAYIKIREVEFSVGAKRVLWWQSDAGDRQGAVKIYARLLGGAVLATKSSLGEVQRSRPNLGRAAREGCQCGGPRA